MYSIYLGASPLGTRLGTLFAKNVKREQIAERLRPVIEYYKESRRPNEGFGDFCHRIGIPALQEAAACAAA
jgi:sulfite reductase (ferredoxin)